MISVDYNTISENAVTIKKRIGDSKLCAVVKSNAYGHGLMQTVQSLDGIADVFAVDETRDALLLSGRPTLVLVPVGFAECCQLIENNVMLTVDSFETLKRVESASARVGKPACVHIKLDTGMCRLGFVADEVDKVLDEIVGNKHIVVKGVYSHLSCADSDKLFTEHQLDVFLRCKNKFLAINDDMVFHLSNTAGVNYPRCHLDMVRVGLGLYGYGLEGVTPAKSCVAKVIAVKNIADDSRVGYGGILSHSRKLAVVKLGYANGYARINKSVGGGWFGEKFLPLVGNVCMGMMMLDATNVDIKVGNEVEILSPRHIAFDDQQIVYELLCNLR